MKKMLIIRALVCFCTLAFMLSASPAPAEEAASIQPRAVISSAAEFAYPPFSIVTEQGQASGFSVELLSAVLEEMGHGVSFKTGSWTEVKQWLVDRKIEVLPLVGRTPEREAIFDFTFPYLSMHGTIVVRNDEHQITSLDDLRGKQVAVLKGDNAEEFVQRSNLGAEIIPTDSFETALRQLSAGQHDAVIVQKLLALQLISQLGIDNLQLVGPPLKAFVQSFCFAVPEGERELLALLNEGLSIVFANGTFRDLHTKWFADLENRPKSRLIVGGDKNYPPYEFLDENGQPTGFNVDLTRALAQQLGLNVKIVLDDWNIIRNKLETGQIDAVQGMFYSTERDKKIDFTSPHSLVGHSIVTRKDSPAPKTMADLSGRSILVMQGDIMHDVARSFGYEEQLTTVSSQEEALRRLAAGEHDCVLVARIPALYWIQKNGWNNLQVNSESVLSPEYCYAVMHGHDALLAQFAEGLAALKDSGEYRQIYTRWFSLYDQEQLSFKTIMITSAYIIIPILFILFAVVVWSRSLKAQVKLRTAELKSEIAERKKTEQYLTSQQNKFRTLFEHVTDYALVLRPEADNLKIVDFSESASTQHGYRREELINQSINLLDADGISADEAVSALQQLQAGKRIRLERRHRRKDGSLFPVEAVVTKVDIDGEGLLFSIERDVSARKKAEADKAELEIQMRQKHKMEAVGVLAGGMAHNFNNNLAVILGNLELAQLKTADSPQIAEFLGNAKTALLRSRDLIKQIMTYSRQDAQDSTVISPAEIIDETVKLLNQTIPSTITFNYEIEQKAANKQIAADATRVQEALINLCNNSVYAMKEKGELTIRLAICSADKEDIPEIFPAQPGEYVRIQVNDTGCGIPDPLKEKIFDPFFTTKPIHEGTGMGLSTVRGIVAQHNGFIGVNSQPEQGSTIDLYFPLVESRPVSTEQKKRELFTGTENLLFVDDDENLATLGRNMLEELGYHVTSMCDANEAYLVVKKNPAYFDLVLTDQTMPGMTGAEFIQKLKGIRADLPVVLCTGYSSQVSEKDAIQLGAAAFCMKPLEISDLAETVRKCLTP